MQRAWLSASLAAIIALTAVTAVELRAQRGEYSMYVSAVDKSGVPVQSLSPTDIVVTEDKARREISRVVPATDGMELALLVDNSQAADAFVQDYREALPAFIMALGEDETGARHQVAVITIGERPTINTDYTLDLDRAGKGAQRIFSQAASGAYMLDGIIEASQGITKRRTLRPVIVAISTEGPELSDRQYQTVLEPLRASGAQFHAVSVGRPENESQDRSIVFDVGARDTGGTYQNVLASRGLTGRLKQLGTVLTHEFKVTYARPQSLVPPSKIAIASAKSGLTVRGTPIAAGRER